MKHWNLILFYLVLIFSTPAAVNLYRCAEVTGLALVIAYVMF